MIDIAVHEVHKYYGSNHVIKGMTFEVYSGEKVGLLGKNGSGKTTLFKAITGDETYDSGEISKASGKKIEMLSQIPVFDAKDTTEEVLCLSFKEILDISVEMKEIEANWTEAAASRYGRLMDEYERLGGYEMETKLNKVCSGMKIDARMRKSLFSSLSGGERTRVNLARILLRDCDILLLDEPTNHLDLASIEWLEKFLCDFPGTILVISHDRVFLDRVITRIVEIDDGRANDYSGNYSFYVQEREQRYLTQAEQYKQQQRKIRQLEAAIQRQRVWAQINPSNTGLAKRALAMEKRLEQMDKVDKPVTARKLTGEFDSGSYASKEIISFDAVNKRYGEKVLVEDLTLTIQRNNHIALIGANGCGKTTLIKMIMGEEAPDSGLLKVSPSVKTAYMPQIIEFVNKNMTVLEILRHEIDVSEEKARSILARFHFKAGDVMKKAGTLSGGEKSRLKLCLMMQNNVNFLILDEPTNHLDIESREWMENALSDFEGTMLFVSHDRHFLSEFVNEVWIMKEGSIEKYICGFDEYTERIRANKEQSRDVKRAAPLKPKKTRMSEPVAVSAEKRIIEVETELANINKALASDSFAFDHKKLEGLYVEKQELEEKLDSLYAQWLEEV